MDGAQALFEAIRTGDAGKVRELVSANVNLVNARNPQMQSAVLMSCYQGRKEIRDLLIEKGATLELHEAVAAGNLNRVKELVEAEQGLAKNYSPDGFPLLALAAAFGHEQVARYLHGKGADINAIATKWNRIHCADRSSRERACLHRAVAGGKWCGRQLPLCERVFAIAYGCGERTSGNCENAAGPRRRLADAHRRRQGRAEVCTRTRAQRSGEVSAGTWIDRVAPRFLLDLQSHFFR